MTSTLIPERPLLVSPSLAATIGLEEATMLSVLDELSRPLQAAINQGYHWYELAAQTLYVAFPFWNEHDIQRVSQSLRAKGVLLLQSAPFSQSQRLIFAINEIRTAPAQAPQAIASAAQAPIAVGVTPIAPNWQPNQETLTAIAQHGIDEGFIRQQVPEFVTFWRESGESHRSWGSKFHKHVLHQWRKRETVSFQKDTEIAMSNHWRPSHDAMDVLTRHADIHPQFIEDAIPEFILYWAERGERSRTWNTKFIQHVRRQWARYSSALEHDTEPKRIPENWTPGKDVNDILRLANIDVNFAMQLLPEFIVYWRDSNQLYASWNTKFLQHVKHHWAKRHSLTTTSGHSKGQGHEGQQSNPQSSRTRDRSISEQLNDRSWAF
ncbi:MAG: DnaT-like ssDNA-binding domain-containing protein [Cellvibrionaceae bacterium]